MEFRLTFGVRDGEYDGAMCALNPASGLTSDGLQTLTDGLDLEVQGVRPGSTGKGAAGPGVEVVLTIVERVMNDGGSFAFYGAALWNLVKRVQARQERQLVVQDPLTIGALAVGAQDTQRELLLGSFVMPSVCLTGGGAGSGTDIRDVWATPAFYSTSASGSPFPRQAG